MTDKTEQKEEYIDPKDFKVAQGFRNRIINELEEVMAAYPKFSIGIEEAHGRAGLRFQLGEIVIDISTGRVRDIFRQSWSEGQEVMLQRIVIDGAEIYELQTSNQIFVKDHGRQRDHDAEERRSRRMEAEAQEATVLGVINEALNLIVAWHTKRTDEVRELRGDGYWAKSP